MKILYVEDDQIDMDLTRRELKKSAPDFIMDAVPTQRDALFALEKKRDYDLVLSDMRLPDGDGLAILTHIRGRGLPVAVVIITGQGDEETAVAALKAGAQDYVVKREGYRDHLRLILEKALECYREASIRSSQPLRVLYVEPSASDVDLTKRHLTNFAPHISMEVVTNASELFQRLSDQHPDRPYDAILLDYRLPGMNALEILKELRQVRKSNLPIILITGQGDEEVAVQALKLGAMDYVVKNPGYLYKLPYVLENAVHSVQLVREHKTAIQLKRKNELILNSVGEGIVGLDLAGNHTFVNQAAARMLGYEISEMVGLPSHSLWHHTKIDGSHCHEEACPIYAACREGVVLHDQEDMFWRKDGTGFPVEFSLMPICEGDRLLGSVLTFRDITERKRAEAERQQLEQQYRQAQKMEAVGRLTGGIAHDFNNLLTIIIGNADLAIAKVGKESPLYESLEDIKGAGERGAGLIRQLLAFSRKQILQPEVVNLNEVVGETDKMLRRVIGEDIDLETVLAPDLGQVDADIGQLEQVIMNLAVNARDAMPGGGKLTIETANVELDEEYARNHVAVVPGPYVMLGVSDTGIGMSPEVQAQVFEPFFTTKEKDKGTGLGLSTVYGIVKQSQGNIWVYSEVGTGTSFKIYLPRVDKTGGGGKGKGIRLEARGGTETVLVVEDEDRVRNLAGRVLSGYGYKVLTAGDGQEAVEILKGHEGPIHLLLTDVVMPGMSGRDLAKILEGLRPEIKVLYMSGYTDNATVHHGMLDKGIAFIQKPFTPWDLARKVREALDK